MTDVFISYSRKDKAFVRRLFAALEQHGQDAWVDWDDIEYAEDWWRKIQAGIEGGDSFVCIVSPSSARSKVCFDEVQHADINHKRIVPVIIEDVTDTADQERMHPALKRQNWLLFRPQDDFDSTLETLLETLRRDPEHVKMHTRLLVDAREWEAHDHDDSLTLRDEALRRAEAWLTQIEGKSPQPTDLHRAYIAASRKAEQRRRQRSTAITAAVFLVVVVIAVVAFALFQQTQSDQQVRASLAQADLASTPFKRGDMLSALPLAVDANAQIASPPDKSLNVLREIAGAPGPISLFTADSPVTTLAFSPTRTRIVAGYADGSLRLWDATQGVGSFDTPLFATSGDLLHVDSVDSVDIDSAGHYVVSAGCYRRGTQADAPRDEPDNTCLQPEINLWEIVDDQLVRRYQFTNPEDNSSIRGEAFDVVIDPTQRDESSIEVIIAPGRQRTPAIINFRLGDRAQTDPIWIGQKNQDSPLPEPITALSVSVDDVVVAGNAKGFLKYYQSLSESIDSQLEGRVNAIAFTPSRRYSIGGRPFLSGSEGGMLQLSVRDRIMNTWAQSSPVNDVAYSSDGSSALAAVGGDRQGWLILINAIETAPQLSTLRWGSDMVFSAVAFGASTVATDAPLSYAVSGSPDGTIILWDTAPTDVSGLDAGGLLEWVRAHRYVAADAP